MKDKKRSEQAILISIKPQYANLIVDGIKTVELRRKFPTQLRSSTRILIYASAPIQLVIGECEVKSVRELPLHLIWKNYSSEAMISWSEFKKYFSGKDVGIVIELFKHHRFESPISLQEIASIPISPPQSYQYLKEAEIHPRV